GVRGRDWFLSSPSTLPWAARRGSAKQEAAFGCWWLLQKFLSPPPGLCCPRRITPNLLHQNRSTGTTTRSWHHPPFTRQSTTYLAAAGTRWPYYRSIERASLTRAHQQNLRGGGLPQREQVWTDRSTATPNRRHACATRVQQCSLFPHATISDSTVLGIYLHLLGYT
ncbi:unnamed protein product, partial [Ectocarpus sp. 12 AP-2014]